MGCAPGRPGPKTGRYPLRSGRHACKLATRRHNGGFLLADIDLFPLTEVKAKRWIYDIIVIVVIVCYVIIIIIIIIVIGITNDRRGDQLRQHLFLSR